MNASQSPDGFECFLSSSFRKGYFKTPENNSIIAEEY